MIRKRIRNILVPIDGSKNSFRGLDNAIYIVRQCHATITGLYVIYLVSEPKKGETLSSIGKMLIKDTTKYNFKNMNVNPTGTNQLYTVYLVSRA
jgi:hypothetical protein